MSSASKGVAAVALVVAIVGGYLWGRSDGQAGRVAPLDPDCLGQEGRARCLLSGDGIAWEE